MKFVKYLGLALLFIPLKEIHTQNTEGKVTKNASECVLFIVSNAHFYGESGLSASNHFSEIVSAYDVLNRAGYKIDFVSPEGGAIPIGYINTSEPLQKKYLYDGNFMNLLENTKKPSKIEASKYKAVYYGGGGAAMFGVPENIEIQDIVMELYEEHNGIISTICHGTAGIVNLKTKNGNYLVAGKKVNGFPDKFENKEASYYKTFPFSIEETIETRGGDFQYSTEGWDGFMISDGRLISGQDPSAARLVAEKLVEMLQNSNNNQKSK